MTILARWRNRPISPRRARRMYEAQRLATLIEDLDRENARREQERDRPCLWCATVPTRVAKPTTHPDTEARSGGYTPGVSYVKTSEVGPVIPPEALRTLAQRLNWPGKPS